MIDWIIISNDSVLNWNLLPQGKLYQSFIKVIAETPSNIFVVLKA